MTAHQTLPRAVTTIFAPLGITATMLLPLVVMAERIFRLPPFFVLTVAAVPDTLGVAVGLFVFLGVAAGVVSNRRYWVIT